jgi:predicted nucleic acid-binding Zn ribbon protein
MRSSKRDTAMHISQAIQELLKAQHLKPKFDEASVVVSWERIVGKSVARRTRRIYIRDKVLFVELLSPSLKQDLGYHKAQMLDLFRKEFGDEVVSEMVLM